MHRPAPISDQRTRGISILLGANVLFTALDISAKWLATMGMPATEIIFMRYGVHAILVVALFAPLEGRRLFRSANLRLEILRGLALLGSTMGNFFAMQYLPLTVTGALMFTMPVLVCALSGPMLGEKIGWRRWSAILVGFVGILIIVRPGGAAFHPAALLSLGGALAAALYSILTRKLAGVDGTATQQFYTTAVALVCISPFAFSGWVWPTDAPTWTAFFAAGTFGMVGHYLLTIAHRFAPPSILAPFNYLQLLFLAFASWLVFSQPPDLSFYAGAPLIIGSGLFIWARERQLAGQAAAPAQQD